MAQMKKVVEAYKTTTLFPSLSSAYLLRHANFPLTTIQTKWWQQNIERGEPVKFQRTFILNEVLQKVASTVPVPVAESLSAISPSEAMRAVILSFNNGNGTKIQLLEVWKESRIWKTFNLDALDVHGNVYSDVDFGSCDWCPDESSIVYIAEKKKEKSTPFGKRGAQEKESDTEKDTEKYGMDSEFNPDWGEQLVGKKFPVVAVLDLTTDKVTILEHIPKDFCPGQVMWTPDGHGVVGVAWRRGIRPLGLIYCTNRDSVVFHATLKGEFKILSNPKMAVRSPRFSPDGGVLVWLEREVGGPHHMGHKIMKLDWPTGEPETLVSTVETTIKLHDGHIFYGIYSQSFAKRCWSENSKCLVFSTPQRTTVEAFALDVETGQMDHLASGLTVFDVDNNLVVGSVSDLLTPPIVVVGKLPPDGEAAKPFRVVNVSETKTVLELESFKFSEMYMEQPGESGSANDFSAIFLGPGKSTANDVPLIVWPHGGPHSVFSSEFRREPIFFGLLGFAMLFVNYRGSSGAGDRNIKALLGHIGDKDVKDVYRATEEALQRFPFLDRQQLVLFGGSHGGFLVTHLSAQYPDMYKAVATRNPVIDVAVMADISDIPDWSFVESGGTYDFMKVADGSVKSSMFNMSPIAHVDKVKAPTLVLLGANDLRVPPIQGITYHYALKARGVETVARVYEDCHPLSKVPVEIDALVHSALWFLEHLSKSEKS